MNNLVKREREEVLEMRYWVKKKEREAVMFVKHFVGIIL